MTVSKRYLLTYLILIIVISLVFLIIYYVFIYLPVARTTDKALRTIDGVNLTLKAGCDIIVSSAESDEGGIISARTVFPPGGQAVQACREILAS